MATLFIADLHLQTEEPAITAGFLRFLRGEAKSADALYILGDLFEAWIGDDDPNPLHREIAAAIKVLVDSGVPCYFIHGNRDFLIGQRYARESGMTLLPEEQVLNLYGRNILIMHGDTLCTDDTGYLAFRAKVHTPWIQKVFLALPLFIRNRIAARMRAGSKAANSSKSMTIMDVNPQAVVKVMEKHRVQWLIHGHTHRPDVHSLIANGEPAHRFRRLAQRRIDGQSYAGRCRTDRLPVLTPPRLFAHFPTTQPFSLPVLHAILCALESSVFRTTGVLRRMSSRNNPARVAIVMGSKSDWATMQFAAEIFEILNVPHHVEVVSAHRTPDKLFSFAESAEENGYEVIIAGAGGAAHLPGMIAAKTLVPVLGVPVQSAALSGVDSLYSIVQMPRGIPVGTLAIGKAGAANAALLAAQILATHDKDLHQRLAEWRKAQTDEVLDNPDPRGAA